MKKIVTILIIFLFLSGTSAQKITEVMNKNVPEAIVMYIRKNIPGATIFKTVKLEEKGTPSYNVAVDVHGHKHIYVFDKTGKFVRKGDDSIKSVKKPAKSLP